MKKFWQNFKLKMTLFRIWLLKNILLFLEVALLVLLVLILTGVVTETTPVLSKMPLIGGEDGLIVNIHKILDGTEDISSIFGIILSIFLTIGMFVMKVKNISQADIKSDKLKLALVSAKLYFNADGRLVKKVEKATKADLNGDGKIDEEEDKEEYKGFFRRAISATKELVLILSTDFSENEEKNKEKYKETVIAANLEDAEQADKEITEQIIPDAIQKIEEKKIDDKVEVISEEIKEDPTITNEEKKARVNFIHKFGEWLKRKKAASKEARAKRKAEKEAKKAEKLAKKNEKASAKEEKKTTTEVKTEVKEEPAKTEEYKSDSEKAMDSFLSSIKKH